MELVHQWLRDEGVGRENEEPSLVMHDHEIRDHRGEGRRLPASRDDVGQKVSLAQDFKRIDAPFNHLKLHLLPLALVPQFQFGLEPRRSQVLEKCYAVFGYPNVSALSPLSEIGLVWLEKLMHPSRPLPLSHLELDLSRLRDALGGIQNLQRN